jgi:ABC-type oligopeptide transport system ATPase subunit
MKKNTLIEVKNLTKHFKHKSQTIIAIDNISFDIEKGTTLGLVGQSGSGKTTLAKTLLHLHPATSGSVFFNNENIFHMKKKKIKSIRQQMQVIFQDPFSSLNPRMSAEEIIIEPLIIHKLYKREVAKQKVDKLLDLVGLSKNAKNRFPHEFSGGQRQRIGIARSLATTPSFIICDEPVSSLDISTQSQIIKLLLDLQQQFNLTYLFIAHDLNVVKHISHRVIVMYKGKIVEKDTTDNIFNNPSHPYTQKLLSQQTLYN